MKLQKIIQTLEQIAPLRFAEEWDNVGLLLSPLTERPIQKIRLTIDLTETVADEAINDNIDLIISYHPILFNPPKQITPNSAYSRVLMKLIQHNIAVYSPHTALDAVIGGVNDWLVDCLEADEVSILQPLENDQAGQGRLIEFSNPISLDDLLKRTKNNLHLKTIRYASPEPNRSIKTVALCAGAGSDAFQNIQADCFFTGEMSHHQILALTQNGAAVILCEHTRTERGYLPTFGKILGKALGKGVDISISEIDADPIQFN